MLLAKKIANYSMDREEMGGNKRYYKNVNFSILLILKLIFRIPDGTLS